MDQRGEREQYSYEDILRCMKKGNLSSLCNLTDDDAGTEVVGIYHNSLFPDILNVSVIPLDLKQTVQVDKDLAIRAYYAGHVCSLYFLIVPYYIPCPINSMK